MEIFIIKLFSANLLMNFSRETWIHWYRTFVYISGVGEDGGRCAAARCGHEIIAVHQPQEKQVKISNKSDIPRENAHVVVKLFCYHTNSPANKLEFVATKKLLWLQIDRATIYPVMLILRMLPLLSAHQVKEMLIFNVFLTL